MSFDAGAVIGRLELGIEGWRKSVETVKKDQQSMSGFAMRHSAEIEKLGKQFMITGGVITAALTAITIKTALAGDNFEEMSERTGISTEILSTLKLAADKSGTSIDSVAAGMKFLSAQMVEFSTAGDKSKTILGTIGISATDANKKLRPMNDVLFDVADRFKGMEDGAIKVKLAVALFGRAGMDLIPILNLGSKGLKENEEAARKLGIEWSQKSSKDASIFADSLIDLKAAGTGLGKTIGESLMPVIKGAITSFTIAISKAREWANAHPALVQAIASLGLGVGVTLTGLGGMILVIPKLIVGYSQLAAAIGMSRAALALSTGVFAVATTGVVYYISKILELGVAEDYLQTATQRAAEQENLLVDKLSAAATAAHWQYGRMAKLIEAYDGNIAALTNAIKKGKEGKDIQDALAKVSEKHAGTMEKERLAALGLSPEMIKLMKALESAGAATKTLAEETGILTRIELNKKLQQYKAALVQYRESMPLAEQEKLKKQIQETENQLKSISDTTMKSALGFEIAGTGTNIFGENLKKLDPTIDAGAMSADALGDACINLGKNMDALPAHGKKIADAAKPISEEWRKSMSNVAMWVIALGDSITGSWGKVVSMIGNIFDRIGQTASKKFKDILKEIGPAMAGQLGASLGQAVSGSAGTFGGLGAGLGAAIGSIIPGVGTVLGSAVGGLIGGLFGKKKGKTPEEQAVAQQKKQVEEYQKIASKYGKVSEGTAKAISEDRKEMQGFAAESKNFASVIKDVGVRQSNVNALWARTGEIIGHIKSGALNAEDGIDSLNDSFEALVAGAKKIGTEGSRAMVEFIKKVRASGLEVKAVTEYVQEQLNRIPAALSVLVKGGGSIQDQAALALHAFNSMVASGIDWFDAVNRMREPLAALRNKYAELGLTADASLQRLFEVVGITEKNKELFDSVQANKEILEALGNSGWLTADALKAITGNAKSYFERLKATGMTAGEALRAMAPTLQNLYNYAKAYGIELDAETLALIEQAKAQGLVKDAQESTGDVMKGIKDVMNDVRDILKDMFDYMRGVRKEAEGAAAAMKGMEGRERGGGEGGGTGRGAEAYGIPAVTSFDEGGIALRRQIAQVAGSGPEAVIPLHKITTMGGKIENNFYISAIDGADVMAVVKNKIAPILERLNKKHEFRISELSGEA